MARNKHRIVRYIIELDTITTNDWSVKRADDVLDVICKTFSVLGQQTELKLVKKEEVK